MTVTIYHNPRCSKSRQAMELLRERGIEPEVVEYLKAPPTAEELRRVLAMMNARPRDIIRKGEAVYRDLGLADPALSDEQLIEQMIANPILIERPIVIREGRAVVGRPPEAILDII